MKTSKRKHAAAREKVGIKLRLYVADTTPRSVLAKTNLQKFCDQYLQHGCQVRIIDIVRDPEVAFRDNILATPTLIREQPEPRKGLIGSLSDPAALARALDLEPPGERTQFKSAAFVQEPAQA